MNIFALYPSPIDSARAHCDQHLHKMILESAQMASTAAHLRMWRIPGIYKPAYETHPCTQWVTKSIHNLYWMLELARELEIIREELNCPRHASSEVIKMVYDFVTIEFPHAHCDCADLPALAMPIEIRMLPNLTSNQKYQEYYRRKNKLWTALDKRPMTWNNRPVPSFMNITSEPDKPMPWCGADGLF
jgi:hypothetical protein